MELLSIQGDIVNILFHPDAVDPDVGTQFTLLEMPERVHGLVVQVIECQSLDFPGMMQSQLQRVLETQAADTQLAFDREQGFLDAIKALKVARCKIRKRVRDGAWEDWDGWIPSRNVAISRQSGAQLLPHVLPAPVCPLPTFTRMDGAPAVLDFARIGLVVAVVAQKGFGKSHWGKLLSLAMRPYGTPVFAFDLNGEWGGIPGVLQLRFQDTFRLNLADAGPRLLVSLVRIINPLAETSANAFENALPDVFRTRRENCERAGKPFALDIPYLRDHIAWPGNEWVNGAIVDRLEALDRLQIFGSERDLAHMPTLDGLYDEACAGRPIVFDLRPQAQKLRRALVDVVIAALERRADAEFASGAGRYPFILFDEAHEYLTEEAIESLVTRARHKGIHSVYMTNTPDKLPGAVFEQADNLILGRLKHEDHLRAVARAGLMDTETVRTLAPRMQNRHMLVTGSLTSGYPLVVEVDAMPQGVGQSGTTRAAWNRFTQGDQELPMHRELAQIDFE